jgi:hypothetical protein
MRGGDHLHGGVEKMLELGSEPGGGHRAAPSADSVTPQTSDEHRPKSAGEAYGRLPPVSSSGQAAAKEDQRITF